MWTIFGLYDLFIPDKCFTNKNFKCYSYSYQFNNNKMYNGKKSFFVKDYEVYLFKNLSNDSSILNEEKLQLEYELKQKTETTKKIIIDLQTKNENLVNTLNEKYKTLFNYINNLFWKLKTNIAEFEQLKILLNEMIIIKIK